MQKLDSYNSNLGTAVLLVGGAGAGKTALGMRLFPKTYVYVADPNFASGKRYLEKINESSNVVGFDTGNPDENGKPVKPMERYDRMFRQLNAAVDNKDVECIFLDSATFIEDYIKAKICSATTDDKVRLQNFDQWGSYMLTWKGLILQLRQSGKRLIVSAHEKKERDESDGIWKYQISLDGQIRDKFPALFSDSWRCEVQESGGTHQWMVRVLSNARQEHLKNNYQFDKAVMSADEVVKKVRDAK
jgi:hypothetical protein